MQLPGRQIGGAITGINEKIIITTLQLITEAAGEPNNLSEKVPIIILV